MNKTKSNQTGANNLFFPLAFAYLIIPNLIFLATWVRPWLGIPAAILVAFCSVSLIRKNLPAEPPKLGRGNLLFVLTLAFFWTLLAGAGGYVPQAYDYLKHNLVFHDLLHFGWPVVYSKTGGGYLCYGLGYYLTPALGGCWLGEALVPALAFLWTFAGMALFFYWLSAFNRTAPKRTLLFFLLFAVTGIATLALKRTGIPGLMDSAPTQVKLEQLGLYFNYHDVFTKLQFQPQHGIVAWIGVLMLYELVWVKKCPKGAVLVWSACLLWSPFTCLGLLLVPLAALGRVSLRDYFSTVNILGGGTLLLVMGIYFQGHVGLEESGPIWKFTGGLDWLPFYFLFVAIELTPVILVFFIDRKYDILGELRPLVFTAIAFLLLLPLWKTGHCSDLRLQAGTPALMLAALGAVRCWQCESFSLKRPWFAVFTVCFLVGAAYPLSRPWLNLLTNRNDYSYAATAKSLGFQNLGEFQTPGVNLAAQYQGRPDSAAARWLLR